MCCLSSLLFKSNGRRQTSLLVLSVILWIKLWLLARRTVSKSMWKFFTAAKLIGRQKEKQHFFCGCSEMFWFCFVCFCFGFICLWWVFCLFLIQKLKVDFKVKQQLLFTLTPTFWWWYPVFSNLQDASYLFPFPLKKLQGPGSGWGVINILTFEANYCGGMLTKTAGLHL